jgi:hypothetical protein
VELCMLDSATPMATYGSCRNSRLTLDVDSPLDTPLPEYVAVAASRTPTTGVAESRVGYGTICDRALYRTRYAIEAFKLAEKGKR